MKNLEYAPSFTDENADNFFLKLRLETGIICKKCKCERHYWISSISMFQCAECEFRTSLKSGTCLQHSKLSIKTWLLAIWYIAQFKKSLPALRLQELLCVKSYKTAHLLLMKIRNSMSQSQIDRIGGCLDSFIKIHQDLSVNQSEDEENMLLVSNTCEDGSHYTIHFVALNDLGKYKPDVKSHISKARSHMWTFDSALRCPVLEPDNVKRWIKKHIRNLERNLFGIYHGIGEKYRQLYFDEFCFRTNCSMSKKSYFESLLTCLISRTWYQL